MTKPQKFNRKSPRLHDFDYTQDGGYFITICTHNRLKLFGDIDVDGAMHISQWGQIAQSCWDIIPRHFPHVRLDKFVVMPNHVHGILFVIEPNPPDNELSPPASGVGAIHESPLRNNNVPRGSKKGSVSAIVGLYKSAVTRQINAIRADTHPLWQRSFHDHHIRNETELNKLREYVLSNPALWAADKYHAD